jgi:hypothetical protein
MTSENLKKLIILAARAGKYRLLAKLMQHPLIEGEMQVEKILDALEEVKRIESGEQKPLDFEE